MTTNVTIVPIGKQRLEVDQKLMVVEDLPSGQNLLRFRTSENDDLLRFRTNTLWRGFESFPEFGHYEESKIPVKFDEFKETEQLANCDRAFFFNLPQRKETVVLKPNKRLFFVGLNIDASLAELGEYNPFAWQSYMTNVPECRQVVIGNNFISEPRREQAEQPQAIAGAFGQVVTSTVGLTQSNVPDPEMIGENAGPVNVNREASRVATGTADAFRFFPSIIENRSFFDHAFQMTLPIEQTRCDALNAQFGYSYIDIKGVYNFFIRDYERVIEESIVTEAILPNMYVLLSEEASREEDQRDPIFKQHITLSDNIPDIFVNTDNKEDLGQYFDKYSRAVIPFANEIEIDASRPARKLARRFRNMITPLSNVDLFKEFNAKAELFPMYFDLEFTTDIATQFADILQDSELSTALIRDIFDETLSSQDVAFYESTAAIFTPGAEEVNASMPRLRQLETWDITDWINLIASDPTEAFRQFNDGVILGTLSEEIRAAGSSSFDFFKNLLILIFSGKLKTMIENNFRSYEDIVKGVLAPNETVMYEIQKIDTRTEALFQRYFIPNSNELNVLKFIDTQVKYNKDYTYRIFAYQFVIGNEYKYECKSVHAERAEVEVFNQPSLKLVKVLFHVDSARVMDRPPMAPDVDLIPYRAVNNQILVNLNSGVGEVKLKPEIIEPEDANIIRLLRIAQRAQESELLEYSTDDRAMAFEIFRIERKPKRYQDFAGGKIATVSTDIDALTAQGATAASFVDNVVPNRKYYYTFRTIDNHGHISNPTAVFEMELVDDNGTIFPRIQVVEFDDGEELRSTFKPGKRFIQIKPTFAQTVLNEARSGLVVNGERVSTVVDKTNLVLGVEDESVWGKTFKIRLVSRKTGKKIDLNVSFDNEVVRKVDQNENI